VRQQGQVLLDGELLQAGGREAQRLRRRRIGVVHQQFGLVARLSALDNVLAGRLGYVPGWRGCLRLFGRADRLRALACLDRVGLLAQAGQRADTLSGGQQQRVALARVLAQSAQVILADEPVASVDPRQADELLALLCRIGRDEGATVICSLHQPDLARRHADRIVAMRAGRVVADGPAERFDDAAVADVYQQEGPG
jgi:phosphonate transport system ATP-binding protein